MALLAPLAHAETSGVNQTHDPSRIIESDGQFYFCSTGGTCASSVDGLTWKTTGLHITIPSWSTTYMSAGNQGVWAPDIVFYANKYYIYYSFCGVPAAQSPCVIGLYTTPTLDSTSANYKLTDEGMVVNDPMNTATYQFSTIDPGPVVDAAGNLWTSWGSGYGKDQTRTQLWLTRLDISGLPLTTDPVYMPPIVLGHALETGRREGSYVHYHNGYYYLFWNEGSCCDGTSSTYTIWVARSQGSLTGPYGGNKVFYASNGNIHGPGHMGVYSACGVERFTYHYYPTSTSVLGENELGWSSDNWPVAGAMSTAPLIPCGNPAGGAGGVSGTGGSAGSGGAGRGGSVGTGEAGTGVSNGRGTGGASGATGGSGGPGTGGIVVGSSGSGGSPTAGSGGSTMGGIGDSSTSGSGGVYAGGTSGGSRPSDGSHGAATSSSGSAGGACGIGGHGGGGDLGAVGMLSLVGAVAWRRRRRLIDESSAGSKGEDSPTRCRMYVLDASGTLVNCTEEDFPEWSAYPLSLKGTSSLQTDVLGDVRISTYFLGLDLPRTTEPPRMLLLWETYVMSRSENVSTMRHPSTQVAFASHSHIVAYSRKVDGGGVSSGLPPISLRCTDGAPCDPHRFGDLRPEERCPYYCEAGGCDQEAVVEVQVDLIRYFCPRHAAWIVN